MLTWRVGVRVEVRPLGDAAEGDLVQLRRAGRDDETVEPLLLDVVDHVVLRAVGAGEHRGLGDHDARLVLQRVAHRGDVDVVGDVAAAVADVDADAPLLGHTGTTSGDLRVGQVGGDLRDGGPGVEDRVDDVLGAGGGARDEDAGDVGLAGLDLLVRLGDVVVLVEPELLAAEELLDLAVGLDPDGEDDEVVLGLDDLAAVLDVLVAQDAGRRSPSR